MSRFKPKAYWCGPTMGKTTAAQNNNNLVDFDDYAKSQFEKVAERLHMSVREMKTSMPMEYRLEFLYILVGLLRGEWHEQVSILVSNAIGLQYPELFESMYIPDKETFLQRHKEMVKEKLFVLDVEEYMKEMECWYDDLVHKHKALEKCIVENKFISELFEK